jgi:hypothetical protein
MALNDRLTGTPEQIAEGYRRIGRFITSCSDLDGMLSAALGCVLGMNGDTHDLVLQSIDFNRKREILRCLFQLFQSGPLKEVFGICDSADRIMQKRNVVAHGLMSQQDGKMMIASINMPAMLKYAAGKTEVLFLDELDKLSDEADAKTAALHDFIARKKAESGASASR